MREAPGFIFALREDLKEDKRFLPERAEPLATGYDCRAAQQDRKDIVVSPGEMVKIPLGFRAFCPPGWWYLLHPRSSFFVKKNMHTLTGIIDEAFPLETCLVAQYLPDTKGVTQNLVIKFGDAIGQIIPVRREDMYRIEVSNEDMDKLYANRGAIRTGGIGSTDKMGFYKTGGNR
jgi:dUTPase